MENLWGICIPDYYRFAYCNSDAPIWLSGSSRQQYWFLGDQNERFLEILYLSLAPSSDRIYGRILRSQEISQSHPFFTIGSVGLYSLPIEDMFV
jgi:hypothetical protein